VRCWGADEHELGRGQGRVWVAATSCKGDGWRGRANRGGRSWPDHVLIMGGSVLITTRSDAGER
jgi:hypothetical protein